MNSQGVFKRLHSEVINPGLCTHCGTCVGLSNDALNMVQTGNGPLPTLTSDNNIELNQLVYDACPGKGLDYPSLNEFLFKFQPTNWFIGCFRKIYIGYSEDVNIRSQAASGGLITHTLSYLIEEKKINGAVVLKRGSPQPWLSSPCIATSVDDILAASQSVYIPTPVNIILSQLSKHDGKLAYVGLPDQVASLRHLQKIGHVAAENIEYVIGPYVGTSIYLEAIQSFLRSNGVRDLSDITDLRYREGEWPGYLQIKTANGRVLKAEKFYYNYLIPFYITNSSLLSVDFTNELTDISVGDAWKPDLEKKGEGYSIVIARSQKGEALLREMQAKGLLSLEEICVKQAMSMHAHMFDFKKRGSFIRIARRRSKGLPSPDFGYKPIEIPFTRKFIEVCISVFFLIGHTEIARRVVEILPLNMIGPLFNLVRKIWKRLSIGSKRKGLWDQKFVITGKMPKDR